jgi:predicted PurR-regulated permease PerM
VLIPSAAFVLYEAGEDRDLKSDKNKDETISANGPAPEQKTQKPDVLSPETDTPCYGKNFPIFLLILLLISCVVIRPLLYGIAWGAVFAFLWHPVHRFFVRKIGPGKRRNACAVLSFLLLMVCITIPLAYTLHAVAGELLQAYESFSSYIAQVREIGLPPLDDFIPAGLKEYVTPLLSDKDRITGSLTSIAQSVAAFLQSLSKGVLQWTGAFIFQAFIALMTLFFMIRDGETVVNYIKDFIPLPKEGRERFIENTGRIMNSVAYGVILTVAVQATLGGIGWAIAGLPKAFLASASMFVLGMFPMGMSLVWLPGSICLIATGSVGHGAALLVWGVVVVSSIDNFLRPILIGSGSSIPTFALIAGLTGGIAAWGLLGVFLGPLVVAVFLSALDLYRSELQKIRAKSEAARPTQSK